MPFVPLDTERLVLREAESGDAAFVLALLNDPGWLQNIGDRQVGDHQAALDYIENKLRSSYREHGFGMYIVVQRSDGEPVGMCGLVKREGLEDVDIGFALLEAHQGRGLALESAEAVVEYAFNELNLKRLVAITLPQNSASCHLLEKLDFEFTELMSLPDDAEELKLYSIEAGASK
jgi:RimJ/RimL family protein N-acetyltransferase